MHWRRVLNSWREFLVLDEQYKFKSERDKVEFWKFARLPSFVPNGKAPFELVYGLKLKLSHLRSFGCLCYSSVLNNLNKFSSRSEKCILIGFSTTKKAYKVYSLDSKLVFYSRDVKLYETVFPFKMNSSLQSVEAINVNDVDNLNFFDEEHLDNQTSFSSPNDDGRVYVTPYYEGIVFPCTRSTQTSNVSEDNIATSMGENTSSKSIAPSSSDLGKLKYFLGIEVLDNDEGICLSQRKDCLELLHEYGLLAAKHVDIHLPENTTLDHIESDDDHFLDNIENYQKLIAYLDAALRVLRYLKGSLGSGIQINKKGYCVFLGDSLVTWKVKSNQLCLGHLLRLSIGAWLLQLVKEKVASGVIKIEKIHTSQQIADVLTKALDIEQHKLLCAKLGMLDMFKVKKLKEGC
uniref:Ribonuclease H-like domain-containing protein n=1 Tax=Tanacetum cinerariifolium TaxID=118510 RepID=A0A6L2LCP1_TANCI|nr:ribonuclease H-like domain-containing protein [Tanacetum cinerariifolium]